MGADDSELEKIRLRKMAKMMQKKKETKEEPKEVLSDDDALAQRLYDRADEVMRAAEVQFPKETGKVKAALAQMFKRGHVVGNISGGELLMLFRSLGLHVRLDSHIKIFEHGRAVTLQDKLKETLGSND